MSMKIGLKSMGNCDIQVDVNVVANRSRACVEGVLLCNESGD